MTKRYLLETSFIIEYLHNKKEAKDIMHDISGIGELTTSSVCIAELYEGALYAKKKEEAIKAVDDFINGLYKLLVIDLAVAKKFGIIRGNLRKRGEMIEDIDIFVAATCLVYDAILVTFNKRHFQRIKGLKTF